MSKRCLILSGGGARGLLQISCIHSLFKGQEYLYPSYDLMIGSSVGAINSSLLSFGKLSLDKIFNDYTEMLKYIFTKKSWYKFPKTPIYDRNRFIEVWNKLNGKDLKLGEAKTKLIITSYERMEGRTKFFKSWEDKDSRGKITDYICRSFAAPMYFGQLVDDIDKKVWFDGGMSYYNLPGIPAIIETLLQDWFNEEIHFDIIGCGKYTKPQNFKEVSNDKLIGQLLGFFAPVEGGIAREESLTDQIGIFQKLGSKFKNIHLKYYDIGITEKMEGMDKLDCLNDYIDYGKQMSIKPILEF
jgi:hypothetical protein